MATCPYCGEVNGRENIIDECHANMKHMGRTGNTRKIYLCQECGEVFEARQVIREIEIEIEVDVYINRPCQYSTRNLSRGFNYMN